MTEGKRITEEDRSVLPSPRLVVVSRAAPDAFGRAVEQLGDLVANLSAATAALSAACSPAGRHFMARVQGSLARIDAAHSALARLAACSTAMAPAPLTATLRTAVVLAEGALACHGVWLSGATVADELGDDRAPDC